MSTLPLGNNSASQGILQQYSDFDLAFKPNPISGDLTLKTGVDAVKQSLKNLILTNFYERAFKPKLGSNIEKDLFEQFNRITALSMKNAIQNIVLIQEPRVSLISLTITQNIANNNEIDIKLIVMIKNSLTTATINLTLDRIR